MRILGDGALLSVVTSTYLLVLPRFNPCTFLKHLGDPGDRLAQIGAGKADVYLARRPARATVHRVYLCFGTALAGAAREACPSGSLFALVFDLLFLFNLVGLLILDWLIVSRFTPRWLIIPGTEHVVMPTEYLYHFKGFLMGTVVSVIGGLAIAALLHFLF
jgi:hypothetical protein